MTADIETARSIRAAPGDEQVRATIAAHGDTAHVVLVATAHGLHVQPLDADPEDLPVHGWVSWSDVGAGPVGCVGFRRLDSDRYTDADLVIGIAGTVFVAQRATSDAEGVAALKAFRDVAVAHGAHAGAGAVIRMQVRQEGA